MKFDLQKASVLKRISAWMLDIILLVVLVTGIAAAFAYMLNLDGHVSQLEDAYDKYSQMYNTDLNMSEETYNSLTEEQQKNYRDAREALDKDPQAIHAYGMIISLGLMILSLSFLAGHLLLEFLVPLLLHNGQTLGKKVFGIALMRVDGVRVTTFMMFVRTIIGKYTLETMIPVLVIVMILTGSLGILGLMVLAAILLIQLGLFVFNKTHSLLHDLVACTVAVDYASQMMFDNSEALLEYKKKLHAEEAERSNYF